MTVEGFSIDLKLSVFKPNFRKNTIYKTYSSPIKVNTNSSTILCEIFTLIPTIIFQNEGVKLGPEFTVFLYVFKNYC